MCLQLFTHWRMFSLTHAMLCSLNIAQAIHGIFSTAHIVDSTISTAVCLQYTETDEKSKDFTVLYMK